MIAFHSKILLPIVIAINPIIETKMIKSLFSWDSKPTEPSPLIDIVTYCASIRYNYREKRESAFLNEIPDIDKSILQKCKKDSILLTKMKPKYQKSSLANICKYASENSQNDATTCVILYHCICLHYSTTEKQSDNFALAFESLNLTCNCNQTLSKIRNFIVIEFIKSITSASIKSKIKDDVYPQIFTHLTTNTSFDSSYFPLFIQLFKQTKNTNNEKCIEKMYDLIIHLLNVHQSFFNFDLLSSFSPILDLTGLNMKSIMILAKLTTKSNASALLTAFNQIAKSLKEYILKFDTKPGLEFIPNEANKIPRIDEIPQKVYEFADHDFSSNFHNFPFELFDDTYNIFDMISEDVQKVLLVLVGPLKIASKEAQYNFITQSLDVIIQTSNDPKFYQITASLFETFKQIIDIKILRLLIPFVASSTIFSQDYHIFDNLPKAMNSLRSFVFSQIETIQPAQITMLLTAVQDRTIVLTECFMRILNNFDKYNISMFTTESMIDIIMKTGIKLQLMPSSMVKNQRNAFFVFLNELIQLNPYEFLKSKVFCENFLYFIYEPQLTTYILNTLRNGLMAVPQNSSLQYCAYYLYKIILNATAAAVEEISFNLIETVQNNVSIAFNFISLLKPLLLIIEKFNNKEILDHTLTLLLFIEINCDYEIDIILYKQISKSIQRIFGDNPNRRVEFLLFGILSKSFTDTPIFLIRTSSVIPVILATFSASNRLTVILNKFMKLCKYSNSNMKACDAGDLVLILSQLILSNHVNYNQYEFDFQLSQNDKEQYVYPLIKMIMLYQSNNSVVSFYIDHLDVPALSKFFFECLCNSTYSTISHFPICRLPRQFTVKGLYGDDLKNGFTVHLTLNIDNLNQMGNKPLDIFTITDTNNSLFSIFIQDNDIFTKYESNG